MKNKSNRFTLTEIEQLLPSIPEWHLQNKNDIYQLMRVFTFSNFIKALDFTNKVGELAEQENHHPAILTEWGRTTVTWWSHDIEGLQQKDFDLAKKTDQIFTQ